MPDIYRVPYFPIQLVTETVCIPDAPEPEPEPLPEPEPVPELPLALNEEQKQVEYQLWMPERIEIGSGEQVSGNTKDSGPEIPEAGADSDAEADVDFDTDADANTDIGIEADANANAKADADTGVDSNTDANAEIEISVDTQAEDGTCDEPADLWGDGSDPKEEQEDTNFLTEEMYLEAFLAGELPDRRQEERRKTGRRQGDNDTIESLSRQYRARLAQTREEILAEISPDLQKELQKQLKEHQDKLERTRLEQEEIGRKQSQEHEETLRLQREDARNKAYLDALEESRDMLTEALNGLEQGIRFIEQNYVGFVQEFTDELKYMALDIAERILRRELDENIAALDQLAMQIVSEIKNTNWINVEVTDQIDGLAQHIKTQLSRAEQGMIIQVDEKDAPPDTLRIITEEGIIDATLSVQLRQLREAFVKAEEEGE